MATVTGVPGINITFGEEDDDHFVDLDDALKKLRAAVDETQPNTLLLQGAREGDLDKVKRALGMGAQVTATADNGDTALHLAVRSGDMQVVRHLILQKADVNAEDGRGYAPLNLAADRREEVIAGMLLSSGANPEHPIPRINETPLITAAHKGCDKLVSRLVTRRVNLNATDSNGVTAAMRAAGGAHIECLDLLTRAGANLEMKSKTGSTAHDFAKRVRAQQCLRVLDGAGDAQASFINACEDGLLQAAREALDAGADVNKPDEGGRIALHQAASSTKVEILEFLLEQKPEIDAHDAQGNTPLGISIKAESYRAAKLLVENGADVDQPTGLHKQTPLMAACAKGDDRIVDLLLQAKASLDIQDAQGKTALMYLLPARIDLMKKLVDLGAHPGLRDDAGFTFTDYLKKKFAGETANAIDTYLQARDARVEQEGSLRAITPLKAIRVKMKAPGGETP